MKNQNLLYLNQGELYQNFIICIRIIFASDFINFKLSGLHWNIIHFRGINMMDSKRKGLLIYILLLYHIILHIKRPILLAYFHNHIVRKAKLIYY